MMMKNLKALAIGLLLALAAPLSAFAQCSGQAPAQTYCGNPTGSLALPGWKPISGLPPACTAAGSFLVGTGSTAQCSTAAGSVAILNGGPLTINPTTGTITKALVINQTTPSSGTSPGPVVLNSITVTNPGLSTTGSGWDAFGQGANQVIGLKVNFAATGAGTTNNAAFAASTFVTGATDAYGSLGAVIVNANVGTHYQWGHIGAIAVWPGGQAGMVIGVDAEVGIAGGGSPGSALYRFGVGADSQGPTQGSTLDAAYVATASGVTMPGGGTVVGWQHLMAIARPTAFSGVSPIALTGDFLFSDAAMTVAHFANLGNVTVTGNILSFPNMAIGGNGTAVLGQSAGALPASGLIVFAPSNAASSGNSQLFGSVNNSSGADGLVANDSSGNVTLGVTIFEASNTTTRFGQAAASWGQVITTGSANAGLMMGTLTSDPVLIGTNNTQAGLINTSQGWNLGPAALTMLSGNRLAVSNNTGTTFPTGSFATTMAVVGADGVGGSIGVYTFQTGVTQSGSTYFKARGTMASPTAVVSGDRLGSTFAYGYATSGAAGYVLNAGGGFFVVATENYTSTAAGTRLDLLATPTGTANNAVGASVGAGFMVGMTTDPGAGIVSVLTGFRQGTMTAGRGLRSDGTNFISAQFSCSDLSGVGTGCAAAAGITALTGDVTASGSGSVPATLVTAQPAVHTWALAQTFTVAPVFTDQAGTRTALGLAAVAASGSASDLSTGTIGSARVSGSYTGITGVGTLAVGTAGTGFVLAGVTMTLGSDATGDIYYRAAGGVLTRLGVASNGNVLTLAAGLPSWAAAGAAAAGSLTGTTLASNVVSSSLTSLGTITSLTATTINAFTLAGTISGGGNNLNNIVIGSTTPLAGTFTTLIANTSVSSPIHTSPGVHTFQSNGSTFAGSISTGQLWFLGSTSLTPAAGTQLTVSQNTGGTPATSTAGNMLGQFIAADTTIGNVMIDTFGAQGEIIGRFAGGTQASRTATSGTITVFSVVGQGWDTSGNYVTGAVVDFVTTASTWSASNRGAFMRFRTVPDGTTSLAEAMRIQGSGGVSIGTTTDPGIGSLQVNATIIAPNLTSDAGLTDTTVCWKNTATTGTILKGSGTLGICLGTSGAQFKTAFTPMIAGLDEVTKLHFQNYRYKKGFVDGGERMQYGLTAQDVETVLPDLVRHDEMGESVNYDAGALLFIGLRAIQQLKADNDNLRSEIDELKMAARK